MPIEEGLLDKVRYFMMRLAFIHPIYLPPVSESFLRKDFNFAMYLSMAYGKTLTSFFNISWITLLVLVLIASLWSICLAGILDFILPLLLPGFFLAAFLLFSIRFRSINEKLQPEIDTPE